MREADISRPSMFVMKTVADYVPTHHPLRGLRALTNEALAELNRRCDSFYADGGRAAAHEGRGLDSASDLVMLTMTAFNLLRMRNIEMQKA